MRLGGHCPTSTTCPRVGSWSPSGRTSRRGCCSRATAGGCSPCPTAGSSAGGRRTPGGCCSRAGVHVARSLRRALARFEVSMDRSFAEVVAACADLRRPHGWISRRLPGLLPRAAPTGLGALDRGLGSRRPPGRWAVRRRGRWAVRRRVQVPCEHGCLEGRGGGPGRPPGRRRGPPPGHRRPVVHRAPALPGCGGGARARPTCGPCAAPWPANPRSPIARGRSVRWIRRGLPSRIRWRRA